MADNPEIEFKHPGQILSVKAEAVRDALVDAATTAYYELRSYGMTAVESLQVVNLQCEPINAFIKSDSKVSYMEGPHD